MHRSLIGLSGIGRNRPSCRFRGAGLQGDRGEGVVHGGVDAVGCVCVDGVFGAEGGDFFGWAEVEVEVEGGVEVRVGGLKGGWVEGVVLGFGCGFIPRLRFETWGTHILTQFVSEAWAEHGAGVFDKAAEAGEGLKGSCGQQAVVDGAPDGVPGAHPRR